MAARFVRNYTGGSGMPSAAPVRGTMNGGIDANAFGGMRAEDALAQFTRQQWQTYVSQFVPIENELIEYAMDPAVVQRNMEKAMTGVRTQFDAQPAITERRMRGMGIQLNADEQAAAKRDTALQKGLAEVQAANTARDLTVDRQRAIMGGPAMPQRDPMGSAR